MLNDQAEVQRIFAVLKYINKYLLSTRQLAQASSEHKASTKVGGHSQTIIVQKEIQNKISSYSTQQYVHSSIIQSPEFVRRQYLNHVEVDGLNSLDLSPDWRHVTRSTATG